MADQRIQCSEEMVGAGHPTKQDTLNRLMLVEHKNDGTHKPGNIHGLEPTDSPEFVTVKLSGLSDGVIPYNVDADTGLADGPTKTDVDDAVTKKHAAVTIDGTSPLSLSTQALSLKNDADAAITEVDTGTLANSDTVIPTSKAVKTYADGKIAKTTNITSLNETGIADGEIAVFNLSNKDIRTSNVLLTGDGSASVELHIEAATHLNQDLTSDAGPTFDHLHIAAGPIYLVDTGTYIDRGQNTDASVLLQATMGSVASPRTDGKALLRFQDHYKNTAVSTADPKTSYYFSAYNEAGASGAYDVMQIYGFNYVIDSPFAMQSLHLIAAHEGGDATTETNIYAGYFQTFLNLHSDNVYGIGVEIDSVNVKDSGIESLWNGLSTCSRGLMVVDTAASEPAEGKFYSSLGVQIIGYRTGLGFTLFNDVGIHLKSSATATTGTAIKIDASVAYGIDLSSGTFANHAINATGKACIFGDTTVKSCTVSTGALQMANNTPLNIKNADAAYKRMLYLSSNDQLCIGEELGTGKLLINIDGALKTLSIDGSGFVKAA